MSEKPLLKVNPLTSKTVFYLYLLFSLLFYFYRYPFSFNDTVTSPTYSSTPLLLQVSKYLITTAFTFVLLTQFLICQIAMRKLPKLNFLILFSTFFMAIYLSKLMLPIEGAITEGAKTIFFLPIIILASLNRIEFCPSKIVKLIATITLLHFISDIVQLSLFLANGRLPALAVPGSIFIRFGGLWDDPNGCGLFLLFPLSLLLNSRNDKIRVLTSTKRNIGIATTLLMIGATLSLTSLISMMVMYFIYFFVNRKVFGILIVVLFLVLVGAFLFSYDPILNILIDFFLTKEQSASEHMDFSLLLGKELANFPFGRFDKLEFHESYYLSFLVNFGVIPLLILLLFLISILKTSYSVSKAVEKYGDNLTIVLYRSIFLYLPSYCFANLALPYFSIFPVNLLFWFLVLLVFSPCPCPNRLPSQA